MFIFKYGATMETEVKIPSVGESVKEATLAEWFIQDGEMVQKDNPLFAIETDKVTLEVVAPESGVVHIRVQAGETVAVGTVAAVIDTSKAQEVPEQKEKQKVDAPPEAKAAFPPEAVKKPVPAPEIPKTGEAPFLSPAVRNLVAEHGLDPSGIVGAGKNGRITKADVLAHLEKTDEKSAPPPSAAPLAGESPECPSEEDREERKPLSPIRKRIAQHLVAAKQNTAMLTTFNEIDMTEIMAVRAHYKDAYQKKYGVSLGFMSFFVKACAAALKEFPEINAFIEDDEIVYHHYVHMGVAIGGKRGLVVPVIRNVEKKTYADIEKSIVEFVKKIDQNRLALSELEGGTFTISNGGVYGSLLSTPILNMPQSGILGMHKIEKRPVVIDDEIVIRPMMYVALSYDHRIVDGREAVSFLKRIKELIEEPERIMLEI
jgi:2-oxoglutarate dehydrogenase E2 component (dihydrolipoamide succinyltransferase)